jgi:hypothetical protein
MSLTFDPNPPRCRERSSSENAIARPAAAGPEPWNDDSLDRVRAGRRSYGNRTIEFVFT